MERETIDVFGIVSTFIFVCKHKQAFGCPDVFGEQHVCEGKHKCHNEAKRNEPSVVCMPTFFALQAVIIPRMLLDIQHDLHGHSFIIVKIHQ